MANQGQQPSAHTGLSLTQLAEMIPDKTEASRWFESIVWPERAQVPTLQQRRHPRRHAKRIAVPLTCGRQDIQCMYTHRDYKQPVDF